MTAAGARLPVLLMALAGLAACAQPDGTFGGAPAFTPVGSGAGAAMDAGGLGADPDSHAPAPVRGSLWSDRAAGLFRDRRAMAQGDVVTVLLDIDDRAALDNRSSRSRNGHAGLGLDGSAEANGASSGFGVSFDASSSTDAAGQGQVQRSERIRLSVAALVTDVLANGNLMVSGRQEVRVNNEMRILAIQGIVRPKDIAADNTVRSDQLAEARVSYGGAGRVSEVQQPALLHQLYDAVVPF